MASTRERVFAAAEQVGAERRPTVSSVREAAGVSNADATRYLKEWREEKEAAGSQVAATPKAVLEHATRLAGTVWAEAAKLADGRHAALEAKWASDRQDKDRELAELVEDFDRTVAEKDREITGLTARVGETAAARDQAEQAAAAAVRDAEAARGESGRLGAELAAAQARNETLQQTIDALIQRIGSDTNDDTKKGTGDGK